MCPWQGVCHCSLFASQPRPATWVELRLLALIASPFSLGRRLLPVRTQAEPRPAKVSLSTSNIYAAT